VVRLGETSAPPRRVSLREAVRVWAYIGINSFGGPAGQIAVMHRVLVETRRWVSERRFLHALNYCMLLPGPEAQQLAVYVGWLMHGVRGGLVAGSLFVLPGFVAILVLSVLYAGYQDVTLVEAVFFGLKAAVLAIVAAAVQRVARRALRGRALTAIAVASFGALFLFSIPFPVVILAAGALGYLGSTRRRDRFGPATHAGTSESTAEAQEALLSDADPAHGRPSSRRALGVLLLGLGLWLGPVLALVLLFGAADVYASQALFFSSAAVVTFGGAYAVLAYVAQHAVEFHGWLTAGEMLDGLALAETTPGPLIMVVEFVGFLAAFRAPGALDPMLAGVLGAVLVTWVTFVPSFLWVFLGAPYAEYLRDSPRLAGTLSAITAAVVGAILNLAVWFGLHVIFTQVDEVTLGPLALAVPDMASLDVAAAAITVGAFVAVFRLRVPMLAVLAASGAVGAAIFLLTGR
jgi:chromate transporter